MQYQSRFDPSRQTVGAIALEARKNTTPIECGDMTREVMKSFIDDLNERIISNPFEGRPFYITLVERKDLVHKNMIHRSMVATPYRPYPENNTVVFYCDYPTGMIKLCWTLPHWSEMNNMLDNKDQFDYKMLSDIYAWRTENLLYFGFSRDKEGKPFDNGIYRNDQILQKPIETSPALTI